VPAPVINAEAIQAEVAEAMDVLQIQPGAPAVTDV